MMQQTNSSPNLSVFKHTAIYMSFIIDDVKVLCQELRLSHLLPAPIMLIIFLISFQFAHESHHVFYCQFFMSICMRPSGLSSSIYKGGGLRGGDTIKHGPLYVWPCTCFQNQQHWLMICGIFQEAFASRQHPC